MTLAENVLFDAALRVPQRISYAEKMLRIGHAPRWNSSMATRVENGSRGCDMGDTKGGSKWDLLQASLLRPNHENTPYIIDFTDQPLLMMR
jgi:hypothetical protein